MYRCIDCENYYGDAPVNFPSLVPFDREMNLNFQASVKLIFSIVLIESIVISVTFFFIIYRRKLKERLSIPAKIQIGFQVSNHY